MANTKHDGKLNIINRDSFPNFKPSPKVLYPVKQKIKKVKLKLVDQDKRYETLAKENKAFLIKSPFIYVHNKKPFDGIFSPLYGNDSTQDTPVYSCACGTLSGGSNFGRICKDCGQPVRTIETDLAITGFVDIYPDHIMSYQGYVAFCKAFDEKYINEIISSVKRINTKGKIVSDGIPTIMDLYDKYEEDYEPVINLPKNIVFMSKIPVYSSRLRPLMHTPGSHQMTMLEVNKYFLSIVNAANDLATIKLYRNTNSTEKQRTLNLIQKSANVIYELTENMLNGKYGVIRQSLAAGRIDYSARLVITLGTNLMPHEVDIPYHTAMSLLEEEIANYVSNLEGIPIGEAIERIDLSINHRDEYFVKIINQILKAKYGVWALINRNPTISESGILYMKIRKIHDDPSDMTMHLPPDILALLAADSTNPFTTATKDTMSISGSASMVTYYKNNLVNA